MMNRRKAMIRRKKNAMRWRNDNMVESIKAMSFDGS